MISEVKQLQKEREGGNLQVKWIEKEHQILSCGGV